MEIELQKVWASSSKHSISTRILALDPGETTGACLLLHGNVQGGEFAYHSEQIDTSDLADSHTRLTTFITGHNPQVVVCEDYKVYAWRANQHKWSGLHTPKLIGVIAGICAQHGIPLVMQMAQQAKHFSTDDKLRFWGMYQSGKKHANDATRHALLYLITGGKYEHTNG